MDCGENPGTDAWRHFGRRGQVHKMVLLRHLVVRQQDCNWLIRHTATLCGVLIDTVIALLSHQTHLPVDAVLEAESVRRGAKDWQLQNEPLDRRRTFLLSDLTQKYSCSFPWKSAGHCFCLCGWTQNPGVEIQQEPGHVLTQTNTLPVPMRTRF